MKRHIARIANTDQRIVVVFMQLPDDPNHALVVPVDNLPPRWEQHLMTVLESPEGQGDPDLGNVMGRRMMPDTTETLFMALHRAGLMVSVPIDNIIMFPEPNRPYSLRQILQAMGRILPEEYGIADSLMEKVEPLKQLPMKVPYEKAVDHADKFNPHAKADINASEASHGLANGLLIEADMLEHDAKMKREQAYAVAPNLRPAPTKSTQKPYVAPSPESLTKDELLAPDRLREMVAEFFKAEMKAEQSKVVPTRSRNSRKNVDSVVEKKTRVRKTNV